MVSALSASSSTIRTRNNPLLTLSRPRVWCPALLRGSGGSVCKAPDRGPARDNRSRIRRKRHGVAASRKRGKTGDLTGNRLLDALPADDRGALVAVAAPFSA